MKKYILYLTMFIFIDADAKAYFKNQFMKLNEVKQKWGTEKFEPNKFKLSNEVNRAKMAYDLIKNKKYINYDVEKIFSILCPRNKTISVG